MNNYILHANKRADVHIYVCMYVCRWLPPTKRRLLIAVADAALAVAFNNTALAQLTTLYHTTCHFVIFSVAIVLVLGCRILWKLSNFP